MEPRIMSVLVKQAAPDFVAPEVMPDGSSKDDFGLSSFRSEYVVNNLSPGRNIDERLRVIDALQYYEQHGEVCPAGWQAGSEAVQPSTEGIATYIEKHAEDL
jgi:alkyl hydroperoxide reductase subunit AhpC